jgi:hypothetical protein
MRAFLSSRRGKVLLVVILALVVRLWAMFRLPIDFDEPVYLNTAVDYAQMMRSGDINAIIDYPEIREHPPLVRLLYGASLLPLGQKAGLSDTLLVTRLVSVVFGTLAAWVVAVFDPLAGLLMAINTYNVKYSSQAYLEALPQFASLAALFALLFSKSRRDWFFWLSALALGVTAAGKYSYFPIFLVILYVYFLEKKYRWQDLVGYIGLAALTFIVFNPALWHNPLGRLYASIAFHPAYAQGAHVQQVNYPWYQPLIWLSSAKPYEWHPDVFIYNPAEGIFSIDGMIFILALVALPQQWRRQRWIVFWIASSVLFLLLWPTKWPQYTLVVIPAFCIAASDTIKRLYFKIRSLEEYYGWFETMAPIPGRVFWVVLLIVFACVAGFIVTNGVTILMARRGWSHLLPGLTDLPGIAVYDLDRAPNGQMLIGTNRGVALWTPADQPESEEHWQYFTTADSPLPDQDVLSVLESQAGELWFGTRQGLARYNQLGWQVFHGSDWGLAGDTVFDLTEDREGRIWIGTNGGAAVFDGEGWIAYNQDDSGLPDNLVLSLGISPEKEGDWIYFGSGAGLSRLNAVDGAWEAVLPERLNAQSGGISDIMFDSQGRLWVATLGSGVFVRDGGEWTQFSVTNSDIPSNRVDEIAEIGDGDYWIATSFPDRPGGELARFDGSKWKIYEPIFTGYSGASTVAIAQDNLGRIWFGTQTAGVDIYSPK